MISFRQSGIYFNVTSNVLRTEVNEKDVISLSVTEERAKLTSGSINLLDPGGSYYSAIKRGATISIEWGYTSDGILPGIFRKGLEAMVISPSHSMGETEETTINFRSGFSLIKDRRRILFSDTKKNVVTGVMASAGVGIENQIVDFSGSSEAGEFRQDSETDFQFLGRLAREWKKQLILGYTSGGKPIGVFIDYRSSKEDLFLGYTTKGFPVDNTFDYKSGRRNVISASIEENFSESGGGDQIRFVVIDGQSVKQSTQAKTETIKALKLDTAALLREQKRIREKNGIVAATKWTDDIMSAENFEDENIRRFWVEVDYKTAAPRSGTKISIEAFGNPYLTIPSPVILGEGFPLSVATQKGPSGTGYQIYGITHSVSGEGYKNIIDIRNYLNL